LASQIFTPELHRLKGDLLILEGWQPEAAQSPLLALDGAATKGAKSVELRAVASLARLRRDQGRYIEARDLLAPIYGWFTEGFGTPDLKEVKALLVKLA
jgi:predicted ATPase